MYIIRVENKKKIKKIERGDGVFRLGFWRGEGMKSFCCIERENEEDEWIGVMCI